MLAVVDDAHWLDDASAAALLVRRPPPRHRAGRAAVRGPRRDVRDLRLRRAARARLDGIDPAASRRPAAGRRRRRRGRRSSPSSGPATGGNPLALVEVADALTSAQLRGGRRSRRSCRSPRASSAVFLDRHRRLRPGRSSCCWSPPPTTRCRPAPSEAAAAARRRRPDAQDQAERSGLVHVTGRPRRAAAPAGPVRACTAPRPASNVARAHRALADALTRPTTRTGAPGTWPPPLTRPMRPSSPPSRPRPTAPAPRRARGGGSGLGARRGAQQPTPRVARGACSARPGAPGWPAEPERARALVDAAARRRPTTRCCAPTSSGCGHASSGTPARCRWPTGCCSRARATSYRTTRLGRGRWRCSRRRSPRSVATPASTSTRPPSPPSPWTRRSGSAATPS